MFETKFVISNNSMFEAYDLGDGNFVQVGAMLKCEPEDVFDTKFDSHYTYVVRRLQKGTPLSNYKSSKYYNEYVHRLKKEHPEYII